VRRRAFTILELLAATALTALLMAAILHVVGSLGVTRATLARQGGGAAVDSGMLDQLRRDLTNATAAAFARGSMTLTSHESLDPATLNSSHEPVNVTYEVASIHGRRWLVRRQTSRTAGESRLTELVCPDVAAFTVRPAGLTPAVQSDQREVLKGAVPSVVTVELRGVSGSKTTRTLVLR
jgi:hypothetical protein